MLQLIVRIDPPPPPAKKRGRFRGTKRKHAVEDLFQRCMEGSDDAWKDLYGILLPETRRHVQNIFRRFSLGKLVQEHLDNAIGYVFEELYVARHEFTADHFGMEFRIFRRKKIIQFMNREISYHRRFVLIPDGIHEGHESSGAAVSNPEDKYHEFMDMVRILDGLPPKYGLVCKLRLLEDLSYADISRLLKINESTARTRFLRAMKKIKKKNILKPRG